MKGQIVLRIGPPALRMLRKAGMRVLDRLHLLRRAALRGKPRGVAFQRDAHFVATQIRRDILRARKALNPRRRLVADEGAQLLAP